MKYKITNKCGITKFYIDDKEIPFVQSVNFKRNNPDELAILEIKVFPEELLIETDKANIYKQALDKEFIPKERNITIKVGNETIGKFEVPVK